jgi:hypothetical protein
MALSIDSDVLTFHISEAAVSEARWLGAVGSCWEACQLAGIVRTHMLRFVGFLQGVRNVQ